MNKDDIRKLLELRKTAQYESNNKKINEQDHENKYAVGTQNTLAEVNSENLRKKIGPTDTIKEIKEAHAGPSPRPGSKRTADLEQEKKPPQTLDALKQYNEQAKQNKTLEDQTEAQQNTPSSISPFKKRPSPFN